MNMFLPTIGLLGLVALMYAAAAYARKKLGLGANVVAPDALKIVGKRTLDAKKALYVVEVGERYILVGTAENSVNMIDHITADEFASMTNAAAVEAAAADDTEVTVDGPVPAQRFMTVGESFNYFLDKAKAKRTGAIASSTPSDD